MPEEKPDQLLCGPSTGEHHWMQANWQIKINRSKPTGHMTHQHFNIQQLYALPTLYLRVFYLSENKQRLVPLTE
jgi:hypothetical protein